MSVLHELGARFHLLQLWAVRDLKTRYAGSAAGVLWAVSAPLFTIVLFYLIFALVMKVRIPTLAGEGGYFFYLLAGLLPWLTIAESVTRSLSSLIAQENFLQKLSFPIGVLAGTVVLTSVVPQLVGSVVYLVFLGAADMWPGWNLLLVVPLFICQTAMLLGMGLGLAVLAMHFRDLLQIVPVVLQFFFYMTPILYPKSMIPEKYHTWLLFNPVAPLMELYQSAYLGFPVAFETWIALGFWTLLLGGGGWLFFRKLKGSLGDYL